MPLNRVLPDTCAWIDFFKGRPTPLTEALGEALVRNEVFICGVVQFELLQGIKSPGEEALVQNAFQALQYLEIQRNHWISAGHLAASLRTSGHILPLSDIIIATLALEHNCAILTIDRHFESISGLKIIKEKNPGE